MSRPLLTGSEATLRVAFVTVGDTSRMTGGYLYNARVIAGLREAGMEVEEVVASGASPEEQRSAVFSLDVARFDVVVVDALARVVCAPCLDRWRETCAVVAMVHELPSVASEDGREREYEEPLLRADLLVAVSDHGASVLEDRGVPRVLVRVVPPGFDHFPPDTEPFDRAGAPLRVLCVAQWIPRKGILELVRAWTARERPGAELVLVGETDADPGYSRAVYSAIEESPDPSIVARGVVDDAELARAYAEADLFALPSRYEGYGLVYAEALAHGLPILACDVGPVPDLVGDQAAVLVPPGDAEALLEALHLLLGDASLRRGMSAAAEFRASDLPRWSDAIAAFRGILHGVSAARRAGSVSTESVADERRIREQNRRSWNAVASAHESHRGDLAGFLRAGGSTLFPEERTLLGELGGKQLVHLQCGSGGDTLSLALLGAEVTGVDIGDETISAACALRARTGIAAAFERADVYDWLAAAEREERRFDMVFSSYGVVCWLPDLASWARGIAAVLEPAGRFVLVDFHPVADMFDGDWMLADDYPARGEPLPLPDGVGDYVGESGGGLTPAGFEEGVRDFQNPEGCQLFRWGLGEVVTALAGAGLGIRVLEEYPYSNGERHFLRMRELPGRRMSPPEGMPAVPLMYGLLAEKA